MSENSTNGKSKPFFKVMKITKFSDLQEGQACALPTSDLLLNSDKEIIQFEYVEPEDHIEKTIVKPGIYTLSKTMSGIIPAKTELKIPPMLMSVTNTALINNEIEVFHKKLDIYKELGLPQKRGLLLHSMPGVGKTSSIQQVCMSRTEKDPGTVVFIWPTSEITANEVSKFLTFGVNYTPEATNLIMIIEDIGGGEEEGSHAPRAVNSSLLNLLDGIGIPFPLPTFIVATTNFAVSQIGSIVDRPGRFDLVIELFPPKGAERVALVEFIGKRTVTEEEKIALLSAKADGLSVAHLKELIVRSLLHDKTFEQVISDMHKHTENFKKGFDKKSSAGIGIWED